MHKTMRILLGAMMLLASGAGTMAGDMSPEGHWDSASGESAYSVNMCGNGTAICVKLAWLKDDPVNANAWPYLGREIITNARQTKTHEWRGTLDYMGDRLGGKIRMISADRIEITGCKFVFCKSFMLNRGVAR